MIEQSKLDKHFSLLAPKRHRVEDFANLKDSRAAVFGENDNSSGSDTNSITEVNIDESIFSENTPSSARTNFASTIIGRPDIDVLSYSF